MAEKLLLGWIGFCGGCLVAGGVVALMVGLGILSRFIEISHTSKHTRLYENCILLGGIGGTLVTIYPIVLPFGTIGLAVLGICSGIYVGGWIMALAEVIHVFPVFFSRIGLIKGTCLVIIAVAAGKVTGSMLHFFMRW